MKEKRQEIACRVAELRDLSEISIEEISEKLNISSEEYISYEDGTIDIPASALYEIAQILNVDMGLLLTGEETRMHIFDVTRNGQGIAVDRHNQYKYENLAQKFIHKKVEPFIVTVEPRTDGTKPSLNSHNGQEFNYILEGELKLYINNQELILSPGDSVLFDSIYPHAMESLNNETAKFLAVLMQK